MKISKIGNKYEVSDISVREIYETFKLMKEAEDWYRFYMCTAIRIRLMQRICRKGFPHAIRNYHQLVVEDGMKMSHDVIRAVMDYYVDEMSSNVQRTYLARSGATFERWSPTQSWHEYMSCIRNSGPVTMGHDFDLRMNLLAGILKKDPNAKLKNLKIVVSPLSKDPDCTRV
jgi:hypothetical protein